MKREIKFRGKRVDNGGFVYGDLINGVGSKKGKSYILPAVINLATLPGCHPLDGYEVIPETVGQYTGLNDRNGKEIYDGDILKAYNEREWIVKFGPYSSMNNGDGNGFFLHEISKINLDFKCPFYQSSRDEIISNIYFTPELLNTPPVNP